MKHIYFIAGKVSRHAYRAGVSAKMIEGAVELLINGEFSRPHPITQIQDIREIEEAIANSITPRPDQVFVTNYQLLRVEED